jgi:hypothetical protein
LIIPLPARSAKETASGYSAVKMGLALIRWAMLLPFLRAGNSTSPVALAALLSMAYPDSPCPRCRDIASINAAAAKLSSIYSTSVARTMSTLLFFMMKPYQKRCLTSGIEDLMGLQLTRVTILLLRAQYPGAMNLKEDGFLLLSVFDNILEAVGDLYEEGYFQRLIVLIV